MPPKCSICNRGYHYLIQCPSWHTFKPMCSGCMHIRMIMLGHPVCPRCDMLGTIPSPMHGGYPLYGGR